MNKLPIRFGPCDLARITGLHILPEENIAVSATWTSSVTGQEFYKLADGRGWVPRKDAKSGAELLLKNVLNPLFI